MNRVTYARPVRTPKAAKDPAKKGSKIALLVAALNEGPQSTKTLMERTGFSSDASIFNAMATLPEIKRKSVDAGCRLIAVYWIEGRYVYPPRLSECIADIEKRVNEGVPPKQAMRNLGLSFNCDSVYRLLRARREAAS